MALTRGSRGEPVRSDLGPRSRTTSMREWGKRHLSLSGDWVNRFKNSSQTSERSGPRDMIDISVRTSGGCRSYDLFSTSSKGMDGGVDFDSLQFRLPLLRKRDSQSVILVHLFQTKSISLLMVHQPYSRKRENKLDCEKEKEGSRGVNVPTLSLVVVRSDPASIRIRIHCVLHDTTTPTLTMCTITLVFQRPLDHRLRLLLGVLDLCKGRTRQAVGLVCPLCKAQVWD